MTAPLFITADPALSTLQNPGDRYLLDDKLSRHILKSLRMEPGEELQISNGRGLRVTGTLDGKDQAGFVAESITTENPPRIRFALVQALAKSGRDEMAVEESTEIGVDEIIPWQADRSIVQWAGAKLEKAHRKWESIVTAASEQSRRALVPRVTDRMTTPQLTRQIQDVTERGDLVVVLHQAASLTWGEVESRVTALGDDGQTHTVFVVVGPEGGISDREIDAFTAAGAHSVVVGTNVLRASTAGPVALTLLSRLTGRYDTIDL